MPRLCIGTSGFSFGGWKDNFYAEGVREKDMLAAYSKTFNSVEINNSFYRMPTPAAIEKWVATVPSDFIFSYKANRLITHQTTLKDPELIERQSANVGSFGERLGPILFQLPPYFKANVERLKTFVSALPDINRYTFEFRDQSWLCEDVYTVLRDHNIALCFCNFKDLQPSETPTADFVYLRMHGMNVEDSGSYSDGVLTEYAEKIKGWQKQGLDVFCYFDNEHKVCAPLDAQVLQKKLQE